LVFIRGFSIEFTSAQKWSHGFNEKFSASGDFRFKIFDTNFGGLSSSYSRPEEVTKIDKSDTSLKVSDGDEVLRLVGYVVEENTIGQKSQEL